MSDLERQARQITEPQVLHELRRIARTIDARYICKRPLREMWPYFSQIDLFNRKAGNSPVSYTLMEQPEGGNIIFGSSKKVGATLNYVELPYEWTYPEFFLAEHLYLSGPVRYVGIRGEFDERTNEAHYIVNYVPRGPALFGAAIARFMLRGIFNIMGEIDARLPRQLHDPLAAAGFADQSEQARRRAEALAREWRQLAPEGDIPAALAEFVITAPDPLVGRMRPYALARHLGLPQHDTLAFCLRAVRGGFLNLSWDLICPSCRGAKQRAATMAEIDPSVHCETCNIDYRAELSTNVEVSFYPVERVRAVELREYCLQSPSHQRHILAQCSVEPHAARQVQLRLEPGHYRLRSIEARGEIILEIAEGAPPQPIALQIGRQLEADQERWVCPPELTLALTNTAGAWRTLRVEHHGYREDAATAAEITALQEFRDSFGAEALRPGVQLEIANIVLLFSDLKDSTALYETAGDTPAFSLVQTHFDLMTEVISRHRGAVIKTIGDAVMAAFTIEEEGVAAALDILDAFAAWNAAHGPDEQLVIKLGLNAGPCIAVTLNERLDYFGSTVNRAARIQGLSLGGDLVLPEEIAARTGVQALLAQRGDLRAERRSATLKGLSGEHQLIALSSALTLPAPASGSGEGQGKEQRTLT